MKNPKQDYQWDVFLSFAHANDTKKWIDDWFIPIYKPELARELGKAEHEVKIYIARNENKGGRRFDTEITNAIFSSRTMVALLCGTYRGREWCQKEYSIMLARSEKFLAKDSQSLVVPVLIHDGENEEFREILGTTTPIDLVRPERLCNTFIKRDGDIAPKMEKKIREIATISHKAICKAPPYDEQIIREIEWKEYQMRFSDNANSGRYNGVPGREL